MDSLLATRRANQRTLLTLRRRVQLYPDFDQTTTLRVQRSELKSEMETQRMRAVAGPIRRVNFLIALAVCTAVGIAGAGLIATFAT